MPCKLCDLQSKLPRETRNAFAVFIAAVSLVVALWVRNVGKSQSSELNCLAAAQALCSALAKMCVRELRTEAPNTSVFYMAAVSLVAAVVGCFLPMAWGDSTSFKVPNHWAEWLLLCGVGGLLRHSVLISDLATLPSPEIDYLALRAVQQHGRCHTGEDVRKFSLINQCALSRQPFSSSKSTCADSSLACRSDVLREPILHDLRTEIRQSSASPCHVVHLHCPHNRLWLLHIHRGERCALLQSYQSSLSLDTGQPSTSSQRSD